MLYFTQVYSRISTPKHESTANFTCMSICTYKVFVEYSQWNVSNSTKGYSNGDHEIRIELEFISADN